MIDGSSIEGFVRIQESDQYLRPDLDTFTVLPWRPQQGKVARLICDVYNPDGTPFTAHTTNPVPFLVAGCGNVKLRAGGCLADIAPTMLPYIGLPVPKEMTGKSIIEE